MSLTGTVKSFNLQKGYGFLTGVDGQEVFLHVKNCTDGMAPQQGDTLTYDLQPSKSKPGQMECCNVTGGTAKRDGGDSVTPVQGTGAYDGQVRRFNPTKGFGFISHDGKDVFFHIDKCVGTMPVEGDWVKFDLETNPKEGKEPAALNVTGGTASFAKAKGKGKDGPFGGWGGGWDAWGMGGGWGGDGWGKGGGWGGDSWGGKGKGGKGKGKGKW